MKGDRGVFSLVSTPDLHHDLHKGATAHPRAAGGKTKMGDITCTTVIGVEPNTAESGCKGVIVSEFRDTPEVGEAGHSVVLTKMASEVCAGDITISVLYLAKDVPFGHCKANFAAPRGTHFVDGVKHFDPCDVSDKP